MGTITKLVEKQMRNWEIARAQRSGAAEADCREVEDFIAISRSLGSGGKAIASKLGEKLRWPVFDKELLDIMAGDDGLRRRIYSTMDERDLSWLEQTLFVVLQPKYVRNDYFSQLTKTVLSLARQSPGVFLGRGAYLILPRHIGLRVGIVAPRERCVATYAERSNLTFDEARDAVERLDRERAKFIQHHFGVNVADSTKHDIVINRELFSLDQTVELILTAQKLAGLAQKALAVR